MLHNVVIVDEVVEEARRCKKKSFLVFKVDYEKVYNSVCWNFLLYMMRQMSFCNKWVRLIEGCPKSASISILVNESPID